MHTFDLDIPHMHYILYSLIQPAGKSSNCQSRVVVRNRVDRIVDMRSRRYTVSYAIVILFEVDWDKSSESIDVALVNPLEVRP